MKHRFVFQNPPKSPETFSENVKFQGDGKKEYTLIRDRINALTDKDKKDPAQLQKIVEQIFKLYDDLQKSDNGLQGSYDGGNFFRELFMKIKGTFDLKYIASLSNEYYAWLVERIQFLANPDFAYDILNDPQQLTDENSMKIFAQYVEFVARFYGFQDFAKGEQYVRNCLSWLHDRYYDKLHREGKTTDEKFRKQLIFNKDNYEFTVYSSIGYLPQASRDKFRECVTDLYWQGSGLKNENEFNEIFAKLGENGDKSDLVKEILAVGNLSTTAGIDKDDPLYYTPQRIYLALAWNFYQGLVKNSNQAAEDFAKKVHAAHDKVYEDFSELRPIDVVGLMARAKASEAVSEDVTEEPKDTQAEKIAEGMTAEKGTNFLRDLKIGQTPSKELQKAIGDLMTTKGDLEDLNISIIASLDAKQANENLNEELLVKMAKLRKELQTLFGFDQIVSLNPDLKDKIQEEMNHYEAFAIALQNAATLPVFERQLDEFSAMEEMDYASNFTQLEHVFHVLRFCSYLPKEAFTKHKVLLERAKGLYLKWAAVLHLPPKAVTAQSPFKTEDSDNFYDEESDEYTYSPMIDVAMDKEKLAEAVEIPEVMAVQLNRLEVIRTLAASLLKIEELTDDDDKAYAYPVMNDLTEIEDDLIAYYKSDQYDGQTPFKLDDRIEASASFRHFLFNLKDLLTPGYAKGPALKGPGPLTQFEEYVKDKNDLHDLRNFVASLGQNKSKYKEYYSCLMKVLTGGDNLDMATVKYAGLVVVKLEREYFDDYVSARILMAKLLQPHMAKSRQKIPEYVARDGREKAHKKAARDVRNYMDSGGNDQIRAQIERAIKKGNPDISDKEMEPLMQKAFTQFWAALIETQTDILYQTFLNHTALSKNYFVFFGKYDAADEIIKADFIDSIDPDSETWNWSDETPDLLGTIVKEVVIMAIAIVVAYLTGGVAGAGIVRWGRFLLNLERFAALGRLTYRSLFLIKLGVEALTFHDVAAGLKGEKTLLARLEKGDYAGFARGLAGEMVFFGTVKAINWGNMYLKQGCIGRGLMRLSVRNPAMSEYVEKVLMSAASKSPEDAVRALEGILKNGVKLAGRKTFSKLPTEVATYLETGLRDINLMRQRYFRIIKGLPGGKDSALRKVCGVLLQDLQFDVLAMILGTAAKNGIVSEEMQQKIDLTTAETWIEMYTMAGAFRGAFTIVNKGGRWIHERLTTEAIEESLPAIRGAVVEIEGQRRKLDFSPEQRRVDELKTQMRSLRAQADDAVEEAKKEAKRVSGPANNPNTPVMERQSLQRAAKRIEADGKAKAKELRAQARALESELTGLEAELTAHREALSLQLQELRAMEQRIEEAMRAPRKLGDFVVPSRIARILPRWLRQHFYKHYVDKQGRFLGSDGLRDVLLGRSPDQTFEDGLRMIESSKRLLLSVNQVLVIASKLEGEALDRFLKACGAKMTRRQIVLFMESVKAMGIKDVPESFNPEVPDKYKNDKTALERLRISRWQQRLAQVAMALGAMGAFGHETPKGRPTEKPVHVLTVKPGDFKPESSGRFAVREADFDRLPEAMQDSQYVLTEGGASENVRAKAWDAKKAKDLFTKDANADQSTIVDNLKKAGAPNEAVKNILDMFHALPDAVKPYVRIFATVDGKETKPYIVIDQKGLTEAFENELAQVFGDFKDLGIFGNENPKEIMAMVQKDHPEAMMMGMMGPALYNYTPFLLGLLTIFTRPKDNKALGVLGVWTILTLLFHDTIAGLIGFNLLGWKGALFGWGTGNLNLVDLHPWGGKFQIFFMLLMLRASKTTGGWIYDLADRLRGKKPEDDGAENLNEPGEKGPKKRETPGVFLTLDQIPELEGTNGCLVSIPKDEALINDVKLPQADRDAVKKRVANDRQILDSFYNTLKSLFITRFKVNNIEKGKEAFQNMVRFTYNEMRIRQVRDILKIEGLSPEMKSKYENELSFLTKAQNNLEPEIAKIPESIAYVTRLGREDMIRAAKDYVDRIMRKSGHKFSPKEIGQVKDAVTTIIDMLHRYPDLAEKLQSVRMLKNVLKTMEPAYKKALEIAGKDQKAPGDDAPAVIKEAYARAKGTIKTYEVLKAKYEQGSGDVTMFQKTIRLLLDKILPDNPAARKAMIAIIGAALLGSGIYFAPQLWHWAFPPKKGEVAPPAPGQKTEQDNTKSRNDSQIDESAEPGRHDPYGWRKPGQELPNYEPDPDGTQPPATPSQQPQSGGDKPSPRDPNDVSDQY